jgi:hypothetical protein
MTDTLGDDLKLPARAIGAAPDLAFAVTAFASAALVFTVEPMVARLVLPLLGGSAAVWNTSLAFFQAALLIGYLYADLLQRLASVRTQIVVHAVVLIAAATVLPLHIMTPFGEPSATQPALWLALVLAVSIGPPFAALSATAPLIQAWHARTIRHEGAKEPYALYAASNLGSLLALLAYPVVVEPFLPLHAQTLDWSLSYAGFGLLIAMLGVLVWRSAPAGHAARLAVAAATRTAWRERLTWLALAAIPSSLMLGVTSYITTDLGSAPFLWVIPLALYLLTFIVAFQARPMIPPAVALSVQAAAIGLLAVFFRPWSFGFVIEAAIQVTAFFFTALICHQALAARRPEPARLTEFYIWMSLGGVIGGAFNAFLAPMIFSTVVEYPGALVLACLARPWGLRRPQIWELLLIGLSALLADGAIEAVNVDGPLAAFLAQQAPQLAAGGLALALLAGMAVCAFILRRRALIFAGLICLLLFTSVKISERPHTLGVWRDFFGVLHLTQASDKTLGDVHVLTHGTTLHGAQATSGPYRCRPLLYHAPDTPIGQVFTTLERGRPSLNMASVGLGAGAVAGYVRPGDALRFFEIDPEDVRVAGDPSHFTYISNCAKGPVAITLGDARLTLAKQAPASYDLILVDAFSSDSVPAHLLTVEATRLYLSKLKPDGVLLFHLSNAHLDLMHPAQGLGAAVGEPTLAQRYVPPRGSDFFWTTREDAVIIGKSPAALAPFAHDLRWQVGDAKGVRPWTDDYTNLFGAFIRRMQERSAAPPPSAAAGAG